MWLTIIVICLIVIGFSVWFIKHPQDQVPVEKAAEEGEKALGTTSLTLFGRVRQLFSKKKTTENAADTTQK